MTRRGLESNVVTYSALISALSLLLTMIVGAAALSKLEFEGARAGAQEWHRNYAEMVAEFEAHENVTGDGLGNAMKENVDKALELLNSMGTCDSPPENESEMDWTFKASMLYVFYVCSTIGYVF